MYDDYNPEGGLGAAYSQMYREERARKRNAFKSSQRYLPEKKLEKLMDDLEGYEIKADEISVWGEKNPLAKYDEHTWYIDILEYDEIDLDRLKYCMNIKKILTKHKIPYKIKDLTKVKKQARKQKSDLEKIINNLN